MPLDSQPQPAPQALPLTLREQDVLRELAQGNSNKAIARTLSISAYTVDGYVKDIYRKLGVHNRAMAAVVALHHGIVDMPSPVLVGLHNKNKPDLKAL